jgi:hypothetical protein
MSEPPRSLARIIGVSIQPKHAKAGTKYIVRTIDPGIVPIEITLVEPETGKALVKDGKSFQEATEATLVGSRRDGQVSKGILRYNWFLSFDVGGKNYGEEYGKIKEVDKPVDKPEPPFVLWPFD